MIWIILTFVFGWLLCGAWAIRMWEKEDNGPFVEPKWLFYLAAPFVLVITWFFIWPERLWKFGRGVVSAWKQSLKD